MPRYDYACEMCSHIFEVLHSTNEEPTLACPLCGGLAEKQISTSNLQLLTKKEPPTIAHEADTCSNPACAWHHPLSDWETPICKT